MADYLHDYERSIVRMFLKQFTETYVSIRLTDINYIYLFTHISCIIISSILI